MNTKITVALTTPQADWLRSTAKREAISIASVVSFGEACDLLESMATVSIIQPRTYTSADLVRAIVGQQWAVAIAVISGRPPGLSGEHYWKWTADDIASIPCAVDVVEGMERT